METGIYVTFQDANEQPGRELPPVGPLDEVVDRHRLLLAERRTITQAEEMGVSIGRWLEAELELQRAMGQEPGGPKRTERRYIARDGVYLRFVVFGDQYERDPVPELGPFAVVKVGPGEVEADGTVLATRASSDLAAWVLTTASGDDFAGLHKSDIAFRTANSAYHHTIARLTPKPTITASAPSSFADDTLTPPADAASPADAMAGSPAAPAAESESTWTGFVERPRRQEPLEVYSPQEYTPVPPAKPDAELTPADQALIDRMERFRQEDSLRARIQGEERKRLGVDDTKAAADATSYPMRYRAQPGEVIGAEAIEVAEGREWGAALWRTRFLIIGVLLLVVAAYYGVAFVTGGAPTAGGQVQYVGIAERFSGTRWDYTVNGTQTARTAGTSTARGEYYIVRLAVTNKGTEGLQISPADFTLVDANGTEYRAEGITSGPYQTSTNPSSPFVWPQTFPIGRASTVSVVFDLAGSPGRGALLKVSELPNTRVRLD